MNDDPPPSSRPRFAEREAAWGSRYQVWYFVFCGGVGLMAISLLFVTPVFIRTASSAWPFALLLNSILAMMLALHVVNRTVIRRRARERFRRLYIDARPPCASCGFDGIPPRCAECGAPLDDKENRETWAMLYKTI